MKLDLDLPAVIDGPYRYWLLRRDLCESARRALFIMLNPSKAGSIEDALAEDPTSTRIKDFAAAAECGVAGVANLFALRATRPETLWSSGLDRVGPHNDAWIAAALEWADVVICAWGARPERTNARALYARRVRDVSALIAASGKTPMCLGSTPRGEPRHPLYLKRGTPLVPFPMGTARAAAQSPTRRDGQC